MGIIERSAGMALPPASRREWRFATLASQELLEGPRGIVERFREPDTWWNNQNEVLTVDATNVRLADVLTDYAWLWQDEGLAVSINPDEYYAAAVEANGNLTLAHRDDGRLLLFGPDHAFANVTPLPGSPPSSLLTIDDVPDLAAWLEVCAAAWR